MASFKIEKDEAMKLMIEVPKIASQDISKKLTEAHFLFELYNKFTMEETVKIFRAFPYLVCVDHRKLTLFNGEFKKYKMTKEQILNVCCNSGGLLGTSVSNFRGVFETLRSYGITAKETKHILDILPEFALQNRKDLLRRKIDLIEKESGRDRLYIRNFVKRHPDILLR